MKKGMAEATRLTRAGSLAEATAVIQRTLRGFLHSDAPDAGRGSAAEPSEPIDAAYRILLHGHIDAEHIPCKRYACATSGACYGPSCETSSRIMGNAGKQAQSLKASAQGHTGGAALFGSGERAVY